MENRLSVRSVTADFFAVIIVFLIVPLLDSGAAGQCPNTFGREQDIDIVLAHQDCNKFYKCFEGKPVEVSCPTGLYFSFKHWRCDWKHKVNCNGRNIPEQTDLMDDNIVAHSEESEDPDNNEDDKDNDDDLENVDDTIEQEAISKGFTFFRNGCPTDPKIKWRLPHESECNQFYICRYGFKLEQRCPPYLHFNKRLQLCDWPRVAGCEN